MTHIEKRVYLIKYLLNENIAFKCMQVPEGEEEQKKLLRALFNVRLPGEVSDEFLQIQDEYLKEAILEKGITDIKDLKEIKEGIYLWKGDITTLKCDAIVNAANSGLTGCYVPGHHCIDNAIHTYAGVELRNECFEIIKKQGHEEETGNAKITSGYNLPAKFVIHTVGPIVEGELTKKDKEELESSYESCLKIAEENNLKNIAFCCISTGVFSFPNEEEEKIDIDTVRKYRKKSKSVIEVVFNVFTEFDYEIYENLLRRH